MTNPRDLATLSELSAEMTRWHEDDLASEQECKRCRDSVHTPSELDPTPLCNLCAQFVAGSLPGLTTAISALTAERDSMRAHVEAQDARIKGLEATIGALREVASEARVFVEDHEAGHTDARGLASAVAKVQP